jgi:hypothetical protein
MHYFIQSFIGYVFSYFPGTFFGTFLAASAAIAHK